MRSKHHPLRAALTALVAIAMMMVMAVPAFAAAPAKTQAPAASLFEGGNGTEKDPYQINTVAQMLAINLDLGASYELVGDIDFSGVEAWLPIGYYSIDIEAMMAGEETVPEALSFHGTFNGNGYTLKNLTIAADLMGAGVFGFTSGNAKLYDVNLENIRTTSVLVAGSLIGWASGKTILNNIHATNVHNRAAAMAGCICGSSNGDVTVRNCTVTNSSATSGISQLGNYTESVLGYGQAGGIIGGADGTSFENCRVRDFKAIGKIEGSDGFGGLAGCANEAKYIRNCSVENVTVKVSAGSVGSIGGLVGFTGSEAGIKNASKVTKISGCSVKNVKIVTADAAEQVGGLVGGGTYRSDEQAQPFAYAVSNCSVINVAIKGGKYVGAVAGYLPANSSVRSATVKGVKWNGKTFTKKVGASAKTVPYTQLTQFGGAL